ncbi:MAG: hypothetical protein ABJA80_14880 [bacterium]
MTDVKTPVSPRALLLLLNISITLQVVMGIALWMGYAQGMRNAHMAIGVVFVVLLWAIAGFALAKRHRPGLAVLAIVWGLVIAGFGMVQTTLLVGDLHWVVKVAHLVIGLVAMPMAELLAKRKVAA